MSRVKKRWVGRLSLWLVLGLAVGVAEFSLVGLGAATGAEDAVPLRLQNGLAQVRGVTAGERSLAEMAGRDRRRKVCLGYASESPDHYLVLTQPQPRMRIALNSEGEDTTLLVLGPRGVDCNDNYRREHRDAGITARDWPAGEYQIWVGAFEEGDRISYQLRIVDLDSR